ncbi:MAG: CarD family transcriptional regulator [Oscillospiraceae bacterium]|nr:CarD family transcriptional regulator [Oscillospiraceae bacterium]MBO5918544.1 CarD family transcriptional regulator [Oscillospiraceae bacterium]
MFREGDKIVHPMHGAGVVERIVQQKINGVLRDYYVLKLPVRSMVVMIPTHNCADIGVRPVMGADEAEQLLCALSGIEVDMEQNWNRRYRENMERLKSGDLMQVAQVIKALLQRDAQRGLSTGERKMLHSAKEILISEVVLAQNAQYEDVETRITQALA